MKKLKWIFTTKCPRSCQGCCNRDWDIEHLPIETDFAQYDEILITGGEPMLFVDDLLNTIQALRKLSKAKIYVYTALITYIPAVLEVLEAADGITITLHEPFDVSFFHRLNYRMPNHLKKKSLRVNIFKGITVCLRQGHSWKVKDNIEWKKNAPLPTGEVLKRRREY